MLIDKLNSGADFAQLAMDYSEDMNTSANGGDLGYIPESSLNQSDPTLKKTVLALKPGQVSQPIVLKDSIRILKLVAREAAGQRGVNDPQVQQTIRDTLRDRKEQLLRSAYLAVAPRRSQSHQLSSPSKWSRPPENSPMPRNPRASCHSAAPDQATSANRTRSSPCTEGAFYS